MAETGSVVGFPGAEPVSNEQILEQPCDVLIPAAVGSVIHARNADRIKARIVAEGANGPTTPEADEILRERGVTVIPDILGNAGGVVVSYFEWVQGLQYYFWRESEIIARLQEIMTRAFNRVWAPPEERRGPPDRRADGGRQPRGRRPRVARSLPVAAGAGAAGLGRGPPQDPEQPAAATSTPATLASWPTRNGPTQKLSSRTDSMANRPTE